MRVKHPHLRYVIGDVRDAERLTAAIVGHDTVIHAAALKRIPECEAQPTECYWTNVFGSMNVVRACIAGGVERCIGISTDKACRAVTAYGASKLAMEKLFQAQAEAPTIFTCVRYGNVVASNGSVIPLWRDAASRGEPVHITDPEATRFWMPPSAAVELIQLSAMDIPGSVLVPKMSSLSLCELANIVAPGAKQQTIGWRSVEKRHEDLVAIDEPAVELHRHYRLWAAEIPGASYTSDTAPRLTSAQFLAMLEEAATYD
jgi:UDP-N-acetylglucosamine 4,6-dehydratase